MNHKELKVWQNGIELVSAIYSFKEDFSHKGHLGRKAIENHYLWDMDFDGMMKIVQV